MVPSSVSVAGFVPSAGVNDTFPVLSPSKMSVLFPVVTVTPATVRPKALISAFVAVLQPELPSNLGVKVLMLGSIGLGSVELGSI